MIKSLDHIVLTVEDVDKTIEFYTKHLGMELVVFGDNRKALKFGNQKINLHPADNPISPHAKNPTPGSADLCFLTGHPIIQVKIELEKAGIKIEQGIVERTGAVGKLNSIYFRDPDGNLIEVSNQLTA